MPENPVVTGTLIVLLSVCFIGLIKLFVMFCKYIKSKNDKDVTPQNSEGVYRRHKTRKTNRFQNLFRSNRRDRGSRREHSAQLEQQECHQLDDIRILPAPSHSANVVTNEDRIDAPIIVVNDSRSNQEGEGIQQVTVDVDVHNSNSSANEAPSAEDNLSYAEIEDPNSSHNDVSFISSEFEHLSQISRSQRSIATPSVGPLNLFDCDRVVPPTLPMRHFQGSCPLDLNEQDDINRDIISAKALQEKYNLNHRRRYSQPDNNVFQSNASIVSSLLSQNISADGSYSNLSVLPPYGALPPPTYFEAVLNEHLNKQREIITRRKKLMTFDDM